MAHDIEILEDVGAITSRLESWRQDPELGEAMLVDIGGGLLRFSGVIFPDVDRDSIFAQRYDREAKGTGPHFDLHGQLVDPHYPWIGVYNLSGNNDLRAVRMPKTLFKAYNETYPVADEAAFKARRHFGALVLESPELDIATGGFEFNTGLILPQTADGPQIVHEIKPVDKDNPGKFVKLTTARSE
jgi:hypothetical protein